MIPSILFITFSKRGVNRYSGDPSVIYRCFNNCAELRRRGYPSYVCHAEALPKKLDPQIVVFHRPQFNKTFQNIFDYYSSATKICDFDDLLFDMSAIEEHPALISGKMSNKLLRQETEKYYQAMELFNHFSVSSIALEEQLRKIKQGANVILVRNGIDPEWLAFGQQFPNRINPENKIISYFSGTGNHQADLNLVVESLNEFLSCSPRAMIRIFGDLKVDAGKYSDRWKHVPMIRFHQLSKWIRQSWITIAPLSNNKFNKCKSAIKFLESGAHAVPLVASPNPEYEHLKNRGLKIASVNDWLSTLISLKKKEEYIVCQREGRKFALNETTGKTIENFILWARGL